MRELRAEDQGHDPGKNVMAPLSNHDHRWLMVPEAAPLLFQAGLDGGAKSFQRSVVGLQIALENAIASSAKPGQILLCHRGTLDPLAYWLRNGWDEDEFFDYTGMTRDQHHTRYFGVIHLQTAAIGAEVSYRNWPHAHRPETVEQSAFIDRLLERAWSGHPRYVMVANDGLDWEAKSRMAREILKKWCAF